jgi:hypothetical protein
MLRRRLRVGISITGALPPISQLIYRSEICLDLNTWPRFCDFILPTIPPRSARAANSANSGSPMTNSQIRGLTAGGGMHVGGRDWRALAWNSVGGAWGS